MTVPARPGVRPEIQALRALAVLAVVANHFWPGIVRGGYLGVDIFFVISGFLITSHLLREVEATGRIRLGRFWARRARRLLPASLLVLAVCVVGTLVLLPLSDWQNVMRHIGASALYVENWALAADAQDYFASGNSSSPVTHYWSLSAEEQFYLVWPLLILGACAVAAIAKSARRVAILVTLAVVVAASLAFSIWATSEVPLAAYFITPTRAWEFGAGGLLAFAPALVRSRPAARAVVAWFGWAGLLASVLLFTEDLPVPGWIVAIPVVACAAVIWAGTPGARLAPDRIVSLRPVQWLGDISYSLYLWHWPLIVFLLAVRPDSGALSKVVLLAVAIGLSAVSKRFVEDPPRRAAWLQRGVPTFALSGAAMLVVVGMAAGTWGSVQVRLTEVSARLEAELASGAACFGGAATAPGASCADPFVLTEPDSVLINSVNTPNLVNAGTTCQQDRDVDDVLACSFGAPESEATTHVALVGDSHAGHWSTALDRIAVERGWRVEMMIKSSCAFSGADVVASFYPAGSASCARWRDKVLSRILDDPRIDMVVTSSISREYSVGTLPVEEAFAEQVEGYRDIWQELVAAGKEVVVIGDVPQMGLGDIPRCVALARDVDDPCTSPRERALAPDPLLAAASGLDGVRAIDLTDHFCPDSTCHSVIGGIIAYGDSDHMTSYFARSMAPYLESAMTEDPR